MTIRFAVIGDAHYVQPECHQKAFAGETTSVTELTDLRRNLPLSRAVIPKAIAEVNAAAPDFVIQTGDIIQGHCDNIYACTREMQEVLHLFSNLEAPMYLALGTHDGVHGQRDDAPIRELVLPHLSTLLGRHLATTYYSFAVERSLFIVVDYATYASGDDQNRFLEQELKRGQSFDHVFLFGHPPLIPVARLGFSDFAFARDLLSLLAQYPVDAYFCGHTHNQIASIHRVGDGWLPQLKGTILGVTDEPGVPLESVRPLLPDPTTFEYGWGFLEDSAPGWWQVTVEDGVTRVEWRRIGRGMDGALVVRKGCKPEFVQRPTQTGTSLQPLPPLAHVKSVRIRAAGNGCVTEDLYRITLNGRPLGALPWLEYFDCRRYLQLQEQHWPLLQRVNTITITTGEEPMCLGGVVMEVETDAGIVRSAVSAYYANDARWDRWGAMPLHRVEPREIIAFELAFGE